MADGASAPKPTLVKTDDGYLVATWTTSSTGGLATGAAVSMSRIKPDSMSVQFTGSFGSATGLLEGSNDNTNWVTCYLEREQTAAGKQDAASFTAAGAGKVADDAYRYYRISTSGGTNTAVVVTLVAQRV